MNEMVNSTSRPNKTPMNCQTQELAIQDMQCVTSSIKAAEKGAEWNAGRNEKAKQDAE